MTLTIAVASRNFFGAERRFFRIIEMIDRGQLASSRVDLLINSSLFRAASQQQWSADVLRRLDEAGRLIVVPDDPRHFRDARRPARALRAVFGQGSMHSVLRSRPLAYARALVRRRVVIEITSPDVADQIALHVPYAILRTIAAFRTVSGAVDSRFKENLQRRFGAMRAARVSSVVECASSPFFVQAAQRAEPVEKQNIILSASRYTARKNVLLTARALAIALPQLPDWGALVLGKGEEEDRIREILAPFIEAGRVTMGYDTRIDERMRASRIYVSMIEPDNYPSQSILEAMGAANALVLSNTGQSELFVEGGPNGVLVDLNAEGLPAALVSLGSDTAALTEMGNQSAARLRTAFSAERHVIELLAMHQAARSLS